MKAKAKLIKILAVPALIGVGLVLPSSAVAAASAHAPAASAQALVPNGAGMIHMLTHCTGEDGG
jgi:hypothetical protein